MSKKDRILLVVNPISGGKDKESVIDITSNLVKTNHGELKIYKTTGENDKDSVENIMKEFNPGLLLVAGGDGTVKLVAGLTKGTEVPIGIIPAGSANGMATALDLPKNMNEAIEFAIKNKPKKIDILQINDELSLHISDMGINAELIRNYDEGNIRGKLGYAIQTLPTLLKSDGVHEFTVEANGKRINRKGIMVAVANASKYGNGACINPTGKIDDGKFEVLIFKSLQITRVIQTILNEIPFDEDFVEVIATREATITTKTPVAFQVDGEYCGETTKVDVNIHPEKLSIVY